jgi:Mn2+/Fe2+ NRAMP family transporter
MAAVQEICDRTALATGQSLGSLTFKRFGRVGTAISGVLVVALLIANALNISADLVAVGNGMNLLDLGPTWIWALIGGVVITALLVLGSFARIALVFKLLCLALLAYVVVVVMVTDKWGAVFTHLVVPNLHFKSAYLALVIAVLGTTISPYLFFWQNAHRLEEMRDEPDGGDSPQTLEDRSERQAHRKQWTSRLDVFSGMAFSNIVMFSIIVAASETLHAHRETNIQSAAGAAKALQPFAGHFASAIFALGFIGSGLLAVPVLAGSGATAMAGLLHKDWGFSRSVRKAPAFYGLVMFGTVGGMALTLAHANPIKLLVLVAVINGVIAAPFLAIVMLVSGSRRIMGRQYVNGLLAKTLGWLTTFVMAAAAVALFATGGVSL